MKKLYLMLSMLFAFGIAANAVPAKRIQKVITLANGTQVSVELRGDEYLSWWEGTDGTDEQILTLLPGGIQKDTGMVWYYDRNWQSCSSGEAVCEMILETDISSSEKSGELSFRQLPNGSELYRITLLFPADDHRREAVH